MSKFIDALSVVGQKPISPMGFRNSTTDYPDTNQLIVVSSVSDNFLYKNPSLVKKPFDALLISIGSQKPDYVPSKSEKIIWGARSPEFTAQKASSLAKIGCDFVVFESLQTQASLLNNDNLGIVATLRPEMSDETIRSITDLQIDAVLYHPPIIETPVTIEVASAIQRVLNLIDKPMILEITNTVDSSEIELIRNMGVSGISVNINTQKRIKELSKIRDAIGKLPKPKVKQIDRDAILPNEQSPIENNEHDIYDDDY
tara:strand:- start:12493 stop:13263 length:771 start_codon:yes stop_codon:yes gene_type:complete